MAGLGFELRELKSRICQLNHYATLFEDPQEKDRWRGKGKEGKEVNFAWKYGLLVSLEKSSVLALNPLPGMGTADQGWVATSLFALPLSPAVLFHLSYKILESPIIMYTHLKEDLAAHLEP